jgi:RimJ/RimL family protein N-acetyltransferase
MAIITETKRLIIREMDLDDFESLKKVLSDPINMQYYPKPYDDNGVLRWINWCMNSYKENGFGLWAVVLKETGEMIGDCGISIQNIDNELKPEIGYHLRLDYHKMGLGHEMTSAIKDYFFLRFNYDEVYSYMNINNLPSEKTAIKNGMRFIKTFESNSSEVDKVYRITRKEWELNRNK